MMSTVCNFSRSSRRCRQQVHCEYVTPHHILSWRLSAHSYAAHIHWCSHVIVTYREKLSVHVYLSKNARLLISESGRCGMCHATSPLISN